MSKMEYSEDIAIKDQVHNCDQLPHKTFNCEKNALEIYHCKKCDFKTDLLIFFKKHTQQTHLESESQDVQYTLENFICRNCMFETYSSLQWLQHFNTGCSSTGETHHKEKVPSKGPQHFLQHTKTVCPSTEETQQKEPDCQKIPHKILEHLGPAAATKKIQWFQCDKCPYKAKTRGGLTSHILSKHTKSTNNDSFHYDNTIANNSVSVLLKTDFNGLPLKDKIKIKKIGRPTPDLSSTLMQISERRNQNRTFIRRFSKDIYNRNKWICGCEVSNLLYCFPCILFSNPRVAVDRSWARTGVKDLHHLPSKMRKHESSPGHINASIALALLENANIMTRLNSAYRQQVIDHNEKVRKNRYILKRIICCVKFGSSFEFARRGHDESDESGNRGIFRGLVDFSAELDVTLREHLQNGTVFKGTSTIIQNDVLDCMLDVCKEEICRQIKNSDFLSVQWDETSDVTNWCQLVLIFRYIYDGNVQEIFWDFKRVKDKSTAEIQKCIEEELDSLILKTPQKLIAQTNDGANVGVQAYIKMKYPRAHYVHCYAHQLNLLVENAASQHAKLRTFFSNLSAIPAFFSNSSDKCDILEEAVKRRFPTFDVTRWNYNIRTVNGVFANREKLIEVFEEIEEKCLKSTTINEASCLRRALEDPEFMFWLAFFHKLLPHVDILYNQIQSVDRYSIQIHSDLQNFEKCVGSIRNDIAIIQRNIEDNFHSKKRTRIEGRSVHAKEVCDVIVLQMKERFAYRGHIQAAELFNTLLFPKFANAFPMDLLDPVCSAYPCLCKIRLKQELEVIYSRRDFRKIIGVMNFLSLILQNDLSETFPETLKLLKVILTTPMPTDEPERCFSTLKRIKTFLKNTMGNDRLRALAMMSINKNFVQDIDNFEEKVLEKFISMKDRRPEFSFKK